MPAEAHRLQRPIGRRDRRLIAAILTASGIAITAATLFAHYENPRRGSAQCVTYNDAGVMGGGTWNLCGVAALTLCNDNPAKSARLETQCAALRQQRQTSTNRTLKLPSLNSLPMSGRAINGQACADIRPATEAKPLQREGVLMTAKAFTFRLVSPCGDTLDSIASDDPHFEPGDMSSWTEPATRCDG